MGPEHFSDKPFIAGTSDIWSLGMSIYELLTGHILWEGMGGCVQLNGARIPALDNGYSPQLDQFLHACLSLNTGIRPTAQQAYNYANSMLRQEVNHALTISGTCFNTSTPTSAITFTKKNSSLHYKQTHGRMDYYWHIIPIHADQRSFRILRKY